jgi:xanthine dehydrogenase YagR molybdenum-binding subunit
MRLKATARAVLTDDGKLEVSSATTDIGTGTYTIMTQIAAEVLGLPIDVVSFRLGDSSLPQAPIQGGSFTAASVGSAVQAACDKVREKLLRLAQALPASMFAGAKVNEVRFENGFMTSTREPSQRVSLLELMRSSGVSRIDETVSAELDEETEKRYAMYIHSAVFAEVRVDVDFGTVRATRIVDAVAAGRIINPKTAASQVSGGVVWGVAMALHEESLVDHALGRFMNHNYAEYHVPVNADIEVIDVIFVEEHDHLINPLGVKGWAKSASWVRPRR